VPWIGVRPLLLAGSAIAADGIRRKGSPAASGICHHALATGFSRGYLVSAGILAPRLIITVVMMPVRRADRSGADPGSER
jgi:hypothetical protein